jgi:hypothetical protein
VAGAIEYLAYETAIDIPFQATVVVDGPLEANISGYSRASDLLSTAERTLPFKGIVHVQNVSEGIVRNISTPGKPDCQNAHGTSSTTVEHFDLPARDLSSDYLNSFHAKTDAKPWVLSLSPDKRTFGIRSEGPTIGPADGIVYEIVSSSKITRPTPACGFNDISVPNSGAYSVETRRYHQYANGSQVAEWMDTVETFDSCVG